MIRHTPRAIEVRALTKVYGTGATAFPALRGVDMTVDTGEFIMLAGPSGSGKTTLLSILGCVLRPTEGSVKLFGESVSGSRRVRAARSCASRTSASCSRATTSSPP
jgi:ABC-type lipoprotein export system ATPase subunit